MAKMDEDAVRRRLEQEAADEALARKLDADPDFAKDFDESFVRGFRGLEDDIIGRTAAELGFSDAQIQKALADAQRARKVAKGGFFVNADPAKAERIIKANKVLHKVVKAKSEKSCFLFALVILAGSGATSVGIVWAAVDLLSRVFS